jgi:hypothetical protein
VNAVSVALSFFTSSTLTVLISCLAFCDKWSGWFTHDSGKYLQYMTINHLSTLAYMHISRSFFIFASQIKFCQILHSLLVSYKATDTAFTLGKLQMEVISVLESIVYIDLNWIHFYRQKTYRDYYCSCLLFTPVIKSNCPDWLNSA